MKKLLLILSLLGSSAWAQTALLTTTLSAAVNGSLPNTSTVGSIQTQVVLASLANVNQLTGNPNSIRTVLFVDKEMMAVETLNPATNTVSVFRGYNSTLLSAHNSGATVYVGSPDQFYNFDPAGACTAINTKVTPWINYLNGNQWICQNGAWALSASLNGLPLGAAVNPSTLGSNTAMVDGLVNPSLAAALLTAGPCVNASQSQLGCIVNDQTPEIFQYWPFLGSTNYELHLTKGIWWTAVPWILASDQILGSGRSIPGTVGNPAALGTTGTTIRACDGDALCNGLYFPNSPPPPPTQVPVTNTTGGVLASGLTYQFELVYYVNLNTAPDSTPTDNLSALPASTAVVVGAYYKDGSANCGGSQCTEVVVKAGTTGSSTSWASAIGSRTVSGGATLVNAGRFTSANTYGYPAPGALSPEFAAAATSSSTASITLSAPTVPSYPSCAGITLPSALYNAGWQGVPSMQYEGILCTGTSSAAGHLYRLKGCQLSPKNGAVIASCSAAMAGPTSAGAAVNGSSTVDANNANAWWQEVGLVNGSNFSPATGGLAYLPVTGYRVLATSGAAAKGNELFMCSSTIDPACINNANVIGCSATVVVGDIQMCTPTATFTLATSAISAGRPPLVDKSGTLISLADVATNNAPANGQARGLNFATRVENLTAECNTTAGIGVANFASQENSGLFRLDVHDCHEVSVYQQGGNSQNSSAVDLNIANPNGYATCQSQRVGGILVDNTGGNSVKQLQAITANTYNNCSGHLAPYSIQIFGAGAATLINGHVEESADGVWCGGYPNVNATKIQCNLLGIEGGGGTIGNDLANLVHITNNVNVADVQAQGSQGTAITNIIQDDNVPAGKGNCASVTVQTTGAPTAANSNCIIVNGGSNGWTDYHGGQMGMTIGGGSSPGAGITFMAGAHLNANGNADIAGSCTMAAGVCTTVTFAQAYTAAPSCSIAWTGAGTYTGSGASSAKAAVTPTTLIISDTVGTDTGVFSYVCVAPTT